MILNVNELPKGKLLEKNTFIGNQFYSYDKDCTLCIKAELSSDFGEKSFSIDLNTMKALIGFNRPEIVVNESTILIKEGKKKYKAKIDKTTFPQFDLSEMEKIELDIDRLKFAKKFTAKKEALPIFSAINVNKKGLIQATNRFVLYYYNPCINNDIEEQKSINIPSEFIDLISEKGELQTNGVLISFKNENVTYISRLIAGDFPKIVALFNPRVLGYIAFNKKELKDCLNIAQNVGQDESSKGSVIIKLKNEKLIAHGFNSFSSEISVDRGELDYEISFNSEIFDLLVNTSQGENIEFGFSGETKPVSHIIQNDNEVKELTLFCPTRNYDKEGGVEEE